MRGIVPAATASAIPSDCTVVAEIGPRTALAAGEADLLADVSQEWRTARAVDRSACFRLGPTFKAICSAR